MGKIGKNTKIKQLDYRETYLNGGMRVGHRDHKRHDKSRKNRIYPKVRRRRKENLLERFNHQLKERWIISSKICKNINLCIYNSDKISGNAHTLKLKIKFVLIYPHSYF